VLGRGGEWSGGERGGVEVEVNKAGINGGMRYQEERGGSCGIHRSTRFGLEKHSIADPEDAGGSV
jgi:hypothetical protein